MTMTISGPQVLGLMIIAIAMLIVFVVALRKQPQRVWLFALALLAIGLGYLATTPAPTEIARFIFGQQY
jgi:dipeptide/tripeptide permease